MNPDDLNRHLVDRLTADGVLEREWRPAFLATPRHRFLPAEIWAEADGDLEPVSRALDPDGWLRAAYADAPAVVQMDDGRTAPGQNGESSSSSASMPTMVALMLGYLEVEPGHDVLEVGTGTGWNAALLAARLGDDHVVTLEIDAELADVARRNLVAAGRHPRVIVTDGALGWPLGAPYDRVISTMAVGQVPHAWVAQTRPGGLVLTPWGNRYYNGSLLRLEVHGDGAATGRVVDSATFMHMRAQRWSLVDLDSDVQHLEDAAHSVTDVHPYYVASADGAMLAIGQLVPDCRPLSVPEDDGAVMTWFVDHASGSWASIGYLPGVDKFPVRQYGPRRLWDEIEAAYGWWVGAGGPGPDRYGVTVTPEGQTVWLDSPGNPISRMA